MAIGSKENREILRAVHLDGMKWNINAPAKAIRITE